MDKKHSFVILLSKSKDGDTLILQMADCKQNVFVSELVFNDVFDLRRETKIEGSYTDFFGYIRKSLQN